MKVKGFLAGAVKAGIKYENRLDLAMIFVEKPAVIAGMFTKNEIKAAPVIMGMKRLAFGRPTARALIVNSGNANACTGNQGLKDVVQTMQMVANALKVDSREVFVSSTGVIGTPMPMNRVQAAIPDLVNSLSEDGLEAFSRAILTTDSYSKTSERLVQIDGKEGRILGIAKGAGMIGPILGPPHATMLVFLLTDLALEPDFAQKALEQAALSSFNRILVDGDTSTNDTVYLLASGALENTPLSSEHAQAQAFQEALNQVCGELAVMIVKDGEGANMAVTIQVEGARNEAEAQSIARTIAQSPLVKTAFFGRDPNWGRVLAAAGRAGIPLNTEAIQLFIGDIQIVKDGIGVGSEVEKRAKEYMKSPEWILRLNLGLGEAVHSVITCDLSLDYVKINADYRT
ncbi:MAG: bifunctional glutamate N-acetyltransferase/amino-acid acetyltransferase ArgJ [Dissulfuribacterales bacterium]